MASTSETGHSKNVANFSSAYQILQEMGTLYNPSNAKIKLATLDPIRASLQTTINELNTKQPIYKNAVIERENTMAPLSKLVTRILNSAKSLDISASDKENIKSQAKKIRGDQKQKKINPETTETESISTSQMSYDSRIANFDTFIKQLASYPAYTPNETALQVASLEALQFNLVSLSATVNSAGNALITARINRNNIMYNSNNNIIQIIRDVKSYLKSLGDDAKPYYNAIVKLKFRDNI